MRLITLLIILSCCLVGCPAVKPDAYLCTFVIKDPIEQSYSYCKNLKTSEIKSVAVKDMAKWITTDPDSFETIRQFYKDQCK